MFSNIPLPSITDLDMNAIRRRRLEANKLNIENKFAPLELAIKAQNALSYNNRMGNIGLFLRGIAQMPSAERQAYLANPENRANYMSMLENFRSGINTPGAGGVLTPEYIQTFLGGNQNPFQAIASLFTGGGNQPQNPMQNMPANNTGSNAFANEPVSYTPNQVNETENNQGQENKPNQVASPALVDYVAENGNKALQNNEVSPQEREVLVSQLQTNNQRIGTQLKNRADNAIALDTFLHDNRKEIGKVLSDAAYYNQLYGRGANWLTKFKTEQPEKYKNYIAAKTGLIPLLSNGIRFLEAMGISHDAQQDAQNQVGQVIDKLDVAPLTAIKVFNDHIKMLQGVSNGVMKAAEPAYPGVRKKLAGISDIKGDYIPLPKGGSGSAPPGKVRVIGKDKDGNTIEGYIPENSLERYEANGFRKV